MFRYLAGRGTVGCMWLPWPDPIIGRIADVVTIVGLPTLGWSTLRLWFDFREERTEAVERRAEDERRRTVSVGCLDFEDTRGDVGINLVPFEKLTALPRPGDFVTLPGQGYHGTRGGAGEYEVERVSFEYFQYAPEISGQPCPAVPSKIIVYVHRQERT
jgi:hypothetical protein